MAGVSEHLIFTLALSKDSSLGLFAEDDEAPLEASAALVASTGAELGAGGAAADEAESGICSSLGLLGATSE